MIDYSYLRPKKAAVLKEWHADAVYETHPQINSYTNATILPLKRVEGDNLLFGRGGVVDENGVYIDQSAINKRVQYSYTFSRPVDEKKKVVYCGYLVNQWGHFLIEGVSRLWYFLKNDRTIDSYVFFVEYGNTRTVEGNYREFLELLGIWDKIEIINVPTKYKEVVVPELGYQWRTYYSNEYKAIFQVVKEHAIEKNRKMEFQKIYLSRSKLPKIEKKEFGLDLLDNYFEVNGYKILYPEKMHLAELIVELNQAEEVATLSGSLPHNLLFVDDKKDVVIVERNVLNNEIQVDVNCIKSLNVIYVDANIPIYSINLGWGPFIMAYNDQLARFTQMKGYCKPDKEYLTEKYKKKCLAGYIKAYKREYHYQWFMEEWSIKYTDYLREGYDAGFDYFKDYILGIKPFMFQHYFELHYWKQLIKRIIHKGM